MRTECEYCGCFLLVYWQWRGIQEHMLDLGHMLWSVHIAQSHLDILVNLDVTLGYTPERNHSCASSAPKGSTYVEIWVNTRESTQERNHSCASSAPRGSNYVEIWNHTRESTQERNHSCASSAPRGSAYVEIWNHTRESTQERSQTSASSAISTLQILDVTFWHTQEKNHSCASSAPRGSIDLIIWKNTRESTQQQSISVNNVLRFANLLPVLHSIEIPTNMTYLTRSPMIPVSCKMSATQIRRRRSLKKHQSHHQQSMYVNIVPRFANLHPVLQAIEFQSPIESPILLANVSSVIRSSAMPMLFKIILQSTTLTN